MTTRLTIVGLGPGGAQQLPLENLQALREGGKVFLRTARHPVADELPALGVTFTSFDLLYDSKDTFEEVYLGIVSKIMEETGSVVYGVPGNPVVGETSVRYLLKAAQEAGLNPVILPAASALDSVCAALEIDPLSGVYFCDAMSLCVEHLNPRQALLIAQVYNRQVAGNLKLTLMEILSDETLIRVVRAAGVEGLQRIVEIPLYELDRLPWIDHLTTVYVPPRLVVVPDACVPLDPLMDVMETLLGEGGCPWDREQTHQSLRRYLVEEAYEVVEAIESGELDKLQDELGDLLLQVVFHACLAEKSGHFNMNGVIQGIVEKLVRRHPHVFGSHHVENSQDVRRTWEEIKATERREAGNGSLMNVPRGLPALIRAERLQKRAQTVGFDWPEVAGIWDKLEEELGELTRALEQGDATQQAAELGDVFFTLVNLARRWGIEPESAVAATCDRFAGRFHYLEAKAAAEGKALQEVPLQEKEAWWVEAKSR